jgi:tripartite-type tricarboxylate transporter receptor subunit TctC
MAQWLSERLGQQFVVENRVGASSNLATEQVVRAPADGYTLIQLNVANAINTTLFDKLSFNVLRDLVPVASFMRVSAARSSRRSVTRNKNRSPVMMRLRLQMLTPVSARCS